jgi:hypothetical protein
MRRKSKIDIQESGAFLKEGDVSFLLKRDEDW